MTAQPKVTGVVRDSAGTPLAGVELVLWPQYRAASKGTTTDSDGRFVLTWQPQNQNMPNYESFLIARDFNRNLALAQAIDDATTNLDLRLEPGLAITGRATDSKGNSLTNVEAGDHVPGRAHGRHVGQAHPG